MDRVIVFGMGKFFTAFAEKLFQRYEVTAILDNRLDAGEEEQYCYQGKAIKVYPPSQVEKLEHYPILIMIKDFWDVYRQLLELQVEDQRILFGRTMFSNNQQEKPIFAEGSCLISREGKLYFVDGEEEQAINSKEESLLFMPEYFRIKSRRQNPLIETIANMPLVPFSRRWGEERGKPIDRYYIENFLEKHKGLIHGKVMEISENIYTRKYGKENVGESVVLHVDGWGRNAIKGNLETGEGIYEDWIDTLIFTQTLMFIYDTQKTVQNIYKMLKPGGVVLATVAGISQISRYEADNWGDFYSFHEDAVKRTFGEIFGVENIQVRCFGNVKTAISLLYGLCCEDLTEEDFAYQDMDYPVIIGIVARKKQER
ncbi:MAG: hypothetical protein HFH00_11975 [Dorea sp.]|nr:hypothetical protein [Dorea sp.]